MKHSAPRWAQKSTQVHGPSAECGPSSAPSSPLTLSKPDAFGRILHQWIVCFQRNPWWPKCNWNFPDAAFKIRILDLHVKWLGLGSLGLYHNFQTGCNTKSLWWLQHHYFYFKDEDQQNSEFLFLFLQSFIFNKIACATVELLSHGTGEHQICHRAGWDTDRQQSTELATLFAPITEISSNL